MAVIKPRLGLCVTMSPVEVGAGEAGRILKRAGTILGALEVELTTAAEVVSDDRTLLDAVRKFRAAEVDLVCLVEATWCEDYLGTDILRRLGVPAVTWGLPGIHTGSLCGCQQLCSVLKELDMPYRFVHGDLDDEKVHRSILDYSRAAALRRSLREARLGLFGSHIKGMTEVAFDELEMMAVIGPRTVRYGLAELEEKAAAVPSGAAEREWGRIRDGVGKVETPEEEVIKSLGMYLALKEFTSADRLAGMAIECYPRLMGKVCLAASLLSEEGIVTSCEGDMNSAAAMLMLSRLTGQPVHNTDLLAVHEEDDSMVFSHCGSGGFSIAGDRKDISLAPVRLMDRGCCVLFPAKPGPVTAVNLVGRRGTYRMAVATGEAIPTEMVFPGNPVRVRFKTPVAQVLDTIAGEGIGHHWMIGYGDVSEALRHLCGLTGLKHIRIA